MERDGLTETSTRSQRALVRSLNFIQKELSSNGRIKEGSNLLLILYTDIWCKVLKVYCGVQSRRDAGVSFQENADGGFARVTVEREEDGCIPGAQKEVIGLG